MGHYSTEYTTASADREWDTKNYDVFEGAFGCDFGGDVSGVELVGIDFAGEVNGIDFNGIDFAGENVDPMGGSDVDFGIDAITLGALAVGTVAGMAATGHHLLSIHHLLNGHKHPTPAQAGAAAIAQHDASNLSEQ